MVERLHSYYDKSHILHGLSLQLGRGEVVSLLGRNGAGKTTTLRSIVGLVTPREGRVVFDGEDLAGQPCHAIARRGIALVPEHRGIFDLLSVEENLKIAERRGGDWTIDRVYGLFPRLKERRRNRGRSLSGGEQQMLAIARALVNAPKVLLLDEPTEGLAPIIVDEIVYTIAEIKASGMPVLLVEQNVDVCLKLVDRVYIIELGHNVYDADRETFAADEAVKAKYLAL